MIRYWFEYGIRASLKFGEIWDMIGIYCCAKDIIKIILTKIKIKNNVGIMKGLRLKSLLDHGLSYNNEPMIIVIDPIIASNLSHINSPIIKGGGLMNSKPKSSSLKSNGEKPIYKNGLEASPPINSHQAPLIIDIIKKRIPLIK